MQKDIYEIAKEKIEHYLIKELLKRKKCKNKDEAKQCVYNFVNKEGIDFYDVKFFIKDCIEEIMIEQEVTLFHAIDILARYWGELKDIDYNIRTISRLLRKTEFDTNTGKNYTLAILKNGERIKSSNFYYLAGFYLSKLVKEIIKVKECNIYDAVSMIFDLLHEKFGICFNDNSYEKAGFIIKTFIKNRNMSSKELGMAFKGFEKSIKIYTRRNPESVVEVFGNRNIAMELGFLRRI